MNLRGPGRRLALLFLPTKWRRVAIFCLLACALAGGVAHAQPGDAPDASICLTAPGGASDLLEDALHRIVAELHAAGFAVERVDHPDGARNRSGRPHSPASASSRGTTLGRCERASGHLWLAVSGGARAAGAGVLSILATADPEETPVRQDVELADRSTTAEMIAIRAVEGLRAAMIQAMRSDENRRAASSTVRRFTRYRIAEASASDPPSRAAPHADGRNTSERPVAQAPDRRAVPQDFRRVSFALGPGVGLNGGEVGMPVELSASWRSRVVALGALVDASLIPATWSTTAGSIELRQYTVLARAAWRLPCGVTLECELGISAGMWSATLDASSRDTRDSESERHLSALIAGDAFGGYFFHPHWGLGGRARVGGLLDAPDIRLGESDKVWGRPTVTGTVLVLGRY